MTNFAEFDQQKNNNLRQVEINEYYSLRNQAIIDIFKTIIVGLIPLIIVISLSKLNIIPSGIISALTIIIIFALAVIIVMRIISINSRDPRNFNHYKIPFDANAEELEDAGKSTSVSNLLDKEFHGAFDCFDDSCCGPDMNFDNKKKKCVLNTDKFKLIELDTNSDSNNKNKNSSNKNFVDGVNSANQNNFTSDSLIKFDKLGTDLRDSNLSTINKSM